MNRWMHDLDEDNRWIKRKKNQLKKANRIMRWSKPFKHLPKYVSNKDMRLKKKREYLKIDCIKRISPMNIQ